MSETPPVTFLVVCDPSVSDSLAPAVATALPGLTTPAEALPGRIARLVTVRSDGCWRYGREGAGGYARTSVQGAPVYLHRYVHELLIGAIPQGFDVDHLCHNVDPDCVNKSDGCKHTRCINPAHLEAVPHRTNLMRGKTEVARMTRRETCNHGHAWTDENTVFARGVRRCRECNRLACAGQAKRRAVGRSPGWSSPTGQLATRDRTHCPRGHEYDEQNTRVSNGRRHCRICLSEAKKARRADRKAKGLPYQ